MQSRNSICKDVLPLSPQYYGLVDQGLEPSFVAHWEVGLEGGEVGWLIGRPTPPHW